MPARRWDDLRHRVVGRFFAQLFGGVGRALCEPGQLPVRGIHRVLICRPNHRLGNALLISPLLAEVETLYPGAEIDIISAGRAAGIVFGNRFLVRQVISLPARIARHLWLSVKLLRQLRGNRYDLAIDASNSSQSGRLLLAIVHARYKLGFPDERAGAPSAWHGLPAPEHFAQRGVFLLRTAYAGEVRRPYPPLNMRLSGEDREQAGQALAGILGEPVPRQRVVGIFANATGAKRYGTDWWMPFLDALQKLQPDLRIVELVADHGRSQLDEKFPAYYTRDLLRLAAVIANMQAVISADCGVMHLAVASGTPTLGLFSVTSAEKYGPYGPSNGAVDTRALGAVEVAAAASDWLGTH
ncbi:MAG: glycosyltransferase family 9 protein [Xanthomonadaceae bacterium]|jgi:ADP-heptose:LPS heptosyltransferase|nr:glycosyltransferase family 9 protein [Xanthomonadaceae bacterium]MDE3071563.1 glycosyltransferase family 9 protein [Pseudomonadota bacterium]